MAKTQAEIQKDWRDRMKAKPLLERLGYPELAKKYAGEVSELEKMIQDLQSKAMQLNLDIRQDLLLAKTTDENVRAMSEMTKNRRVNLPNF